ncbi:hypothetical protein Leryth_002381, partial [Lithospermum erythrorhizon]
MLRHAPLSSVAGLLSDLRGHDQVSCMFWLLHSDLHEIKAVAALEYISSMLANIEVIAQVPSGQKFNSENISLIEQNFRRGRFNVHFKRRNGRVRLMSEELSVEQSEIRFVSLTSEEEAIAQNLVPKVQFNLHLTEKERNDREKIMLKQLKFMMVEGLLVRIKSRTRMKLPRMSNRLRILAWGRLYIFVIQTMRCLILMKNLIMIWTFGTLHFHLSLKLDISRVQKPI